MAPRISPIALVYLIGLIGIAAALQLQGAEVGVPIRAKRQSGQRPQVQLDDGRQSPVSASAQGSALASVSSLSSPSTADVQLGGGMSGVNPTVSRPAARRPKKPASVTMVDAEAELALEDDERPVRVKPKRGRRPIGRRPVQYDEEGGADDDDEACLDDYDYGHGMHEAAMGQMRHFGRMMDGMFTKMRNMAAGGDFDGFPGGGSAAVATSTSGGDGYSRTSSMVNNNGRTRGIITETRNGRTRTRRIGNDDEYDE